MYGLSLIILSILPQAFGCDQHQNYLKPRHDKRQAFNISNTGRTPTYWQYEASNNWGKLSPDYELCQTGTQQSPIALSLNQGISRRHQPLFTGYNVPNATGEYYNWGYGPAFTFYRPEADYSSLPSMEVDNETLYLVGWHLHAPADHSVGGVRSKAELHYVHYDISSKERAVVAIRIDPGTKSSPFFELLPPPIHFNDTSAIQNVQIDPLQPIREVNDFTEFWSYKGSLTSPPCKEGIQWFLAKNVLFTSTAQMQNILRVSTFSARAEQDVWAHEVNV